ncbi:MAG: RimK family alpha-L-glutamate ligase, partial [Chitinophagales bacterium]
MAVPEYDVVLLTDSRYVNPENPDAYVQNILEEDRLLSMALSRHGIKVFRTNWDNPDFNWRTTRAIVFRTTWDYFHRFAEFSAWLQKVCGETYLINTLDLLQWNMDKHYLSDLSEMGIAIPPTVFIEKGNTAQLQNAVNELEWSEFIIKPAVGGAGRLTYKFNKNTLCAVMRHLQPYLHAEAFLLQPFLPSVVS